MATITSLIRLKYDEIYILRKYITERNVSSVCTDDTFLLRYILSFGSAKSAEEPILKALEWRHNNRQMLKDLHERNIIPYEEIVKKYICLEQHPLTTDSEPVIFLKLENINIGDLLNHITIEQFGDYLMMFNERNFQLCDSISREKNQFVKQLFVIDMHNASMWSLMNPTAITYVGALQDIAYYLFPEINDKIILRNVPYFIKMFYSFLSVENLKKIIIDA